MDIKLFKWIYKDSLVFEVGFFVLRFADLSICQYKVFKSWLDIRLFFINLLHTLLGEYTAFWLSVLNQFVSCTILHHEFKEFMWIIFFLLRVCFF